MRDRLAGVLGEETDTEVLVTRLLGGALVLALLVVIVFTIAPVKTDDTYTEFYVLGPDGSASGYPENVSVGETATVRIGIGNFESRALTYTLVVRTNETIFETRNVTLTPGEEWEEPMDVTFDSPGSRRLLFELYVGETARGEPYRSLRLLVEVTPE